MKKTLIPVLFVLVLLFIRQSLGKSGSPITPHEAIKQMSRGINMGNTLEPPHEGDWNNGPAQEYYFDDYRKAGFSCVRIPVRWDEHTGKVAPYIVDPNWLQRVEQVVDWGLERDLFIIINTHHDNWIKENYGDPNCRDRFDSIWRQVSARFKDKRGKLLFEVINEPAGLTMLQINELNERILKIIRKTNPTRLVVYSGNEYTMPDQLINAAIPDDDYVIGTFHLYMPASFAYEEKAKTWGSDEEKAVIRNEFEKVAKWSKKNNIAVLFGEFAALSSGEKSSRIEFYTTYVEQALKHGFAFTVWDDGGGMEVYQRKTRDWNYLKDILINTP